MSDSDGTPKIIVQGDTTEWSVSLSDYPATDWELAYTFFNALTTIKLTATADDDDYLIQITAAESSVFTPGEYSWTTKVTDLATGLEVHTVGVGNTTVQPDVSELNKYDGRSWAEIALDNVEAVIGNRATLDQESYSIAGRSLGRTPLTDLINLRKYLQAEVSSQRDELNGVNTKKAVVRF